MCFWKSKHIYLLQLERCLLHSARIRAGCCCGAVSEQWTQHSQAGQRREESLELANKNIPDYSLRNRGSRGRSTKGEGADPTGDRMKKIWKNCYMLGTKSFSGDWKTIAGSHDADWCWLMNPRELGTYRGAGEGGKDWLLDFFPDPRPLHIRVRSQNETSVSTGCHCLMALKFLIFFQM